MKEIQAIVLATHNRDKREELQQSAVKSIIERTTKRIEIDKNDFLEFNQNDLSNELEKLASRINMDTETLKNICISNGLDFSIVKNQIKTELLWNSLIFNLYKNRISINQTEIEDQLKFSKNKKDFEEYLISEIVIKPEEEDKLESQIEEIKNKIKIEGFESVAMNLSISQSAVKGGDLGWVKENVISKKFRSKIINTPPGSLSEPILLNEGILIYKVRDKRKIKNETSLEELKDQLIRSEKTKILDMYSRSHYESLKRSVSIKFFDE